MKQHKDVLIRNAFEKADKAIKSAQASIEDGFLSTAQNRIYYGIFYSVVALGYFYDFTSSKHSSYLSWFNKKFIYTDKIFKEAYESRQKSDYEFTWKPLKDDVMSDLSDSGFFIAQIKTHLNLKIHP